MAREAPSARMPDEYGGRCDRDNAVHVSEEETTWAAVRILRAWIECYGVPRALYTTGTLLSGYKLNKIN